jgi:hypothetical protein
MTQTIEITVSPQGETTIQTKGFSGSTCKDASRFIERALGEKVAEQRTTEFYRSQAAVEQVRQR